MIYFVSMLLFVLVSGIIADDYYKEKVEPGKRYAIENPGFPGRSSPAPINGWHFTSDMPIKIDCIIFDLPEPLNCPPLMFLINDGINGHKLRGNQSFSAVTKSNELKIVYYHPPGTNKGGMFRCEVTTTQKTCTEYTCGTKTCTTKEYLQDVISGKNLCNNRN